MNEEILNISSGELIITQGEEADGFYILHSGKVEVIKDGVLLSVLQQPGTLFGEMGGTLNKPRTCTVRAKDPSKIIHVKTYNLREFIKNNPDTVTEIFKTLSGRLERTTKKLAQLARSS